MEIAGGKPAQIENRQHLGHLGRTPHVGRQDAATKALALTVFITAGVIDPRRLKLHRPGSQGKLAPLGPTVAHHQRASVLVARAAMALDVIVGLGPERFD